jgi:RHS repeat-associated protein
LSLHRTRHLFIRQQTAIINAIRAHLTSTGMCMYPSIPMRGSTNVVTNASGTVVQTLDYYPYGATRISTSVGGADSARKYIGQFADASNLDYLNARYDASDRGQFTSEDPASLVLG